MKKTIYIFTALFILTSCAQTKKIGTCCDSTYKSVDDALTCYTQTNNNKGTTADDRLFLIAFVSRNVAANQEKGWNILNDTEVISVAKRNYLLIIVDSNHFQIPTTEESSALMQKIKSHTDSLFFVITNPSLYPLADWGADEKKDIIIDRLTVGNGP